MALNKYIKIANTLNDECIRRVLTIDSENTEYLEEILTLFTDIEVHRGVILGVKTTLSI